MRHCRAKIVATLGPASWDADTIERLVDEGVDAFRLNYSHVPPDGYRSVADRVRAVAGKTGRGIALLADLSGPKIRVGDLPEEGIPLTEGSRVVLYGGDPPPGREGIGTNFPRLVHDVRVGQSILLDDGSIALVAEDVGREEVTARVVRGGILRSHKGLNLPDSDLGLTLPTEKDRRDIRTALSIGVDAFAVSFVRSAADMRAVREAVGDETIPLYAKIEKPQAVDRIDEILDASDGVMVARGDLGVEMSLPRVPLVQKRILRAALARGAPSITATQMLESMIHRPVPTRAEAADIANAVLDGSAALMLSGETAVGSYPVEAVRAMNDIIHEAEKGLHGFRQEVRRGSSPTEAVAHAACAAAADLAVRAIVVFTISGRTAQLVSQRRPLCPIYALTPDRRVFQRLAMIWGIEPFLFPIMDDSDAMVREADRVLCEAGLAAPGNTVILIGGTSPLPGATNMMMAHVVQRSDGGKGGNEG